MNIVKTEIDTNPQQTRDENLHNNKLSRVIPRFISLARSLPIIFARPHRERER